MGDHPSSYRRAGTIRGGRHQPSGDVLARAPAVARQLQLERLAAVDRVGADLDHEFVSAGLNLLDVGHLDLAEPGW
jgi:hypothetical protein